MNCLDTYALVEIQNGNVDYDSISQQPFVISQPTIIEYFDTLYKNGWTAEQIKDIINPFIPFVENVDTQTQFEAVQFRRQNSKDNLSFYDAVGYIFAQKSGYTFVTGDKAFKNKKGVIFIPFRK